MSQRIRGISDDEATGAAKELFEGSNKLLGRTANLLRILAHSPELARWYLGFVAAVRQPKTCGCATSRYSRLPRSTVASTEPSTTGCLVKHWV